MTETNYPKSSWNISFIIPIIGFINKIIVKIPFIGRTLLSFSNRMTGKSLPYFTFLGFRKAATYENAIWNWEIFLSLIGAKYSAEEISPDIKVYTIFKCPAGYCQKRHLDACKVTMEIDSNLVKRSGAKLIVEKRFPIDGVCIEHVIRS
jgi:hypothetical protein